MKKSIMVSVCVALSGCTTPEQPVFENKIQATPSKPGDFEEIKRPLQPDFKKYEKNDKPSTPPIFSHFPSEPKQEEQAWQKEKLIQKVMERKSNYDGLNK